MLTRTTRAGWASPFDALLDVHREMDRMIEGDGNGREAWRPLATDVIETPDEVRVMVEVPGLSAEQVEITIDENVLRISGEKQGVRAEGEGTTYRLTERRYGRFERSFVLPRDVDPDKASAACEDGVLSVVLPKREEAKPRRVEVRAASSGREVGPSEA